MDTQKTSFYRSVLAESAVFRGLEPAVLDSILQLGLLLEAKAGDQVFYENMRGGIGLYLILDGEVEVFRAGAGGPEAGAAPVTLSVLVPGQCFGEYSLMDEHNTSASARAVTDSKLLFLPRGQFLQLVERDPVVGRHVYRNLLVYLIARLRQR